ncbi:hypothetical protein B0H16DRAFT_1471748 [Mycena metata]|uniref:Uncharacterized protein n=1 Tax=Mycena metata TaxID=1033252 RepID=A0AAD7HRJ2_9AGAR|nr:hypothetical protein B0H16DRAFT_1471748 [Mycena metata]
MPSNDLFLTSTVTFYEPVTKPKCPRFGKIAGLAKRVRQDMSALRLPTGHNSLRAGVTSPKKNDPWTTVMGLEGIEPRRALEQRFHPTISPSMGILNQAEMLDTSNSKRKKQFRNYNVRVVGPDYAPLPTPSGELESEERLKTPARVLLALAEGAVEWVAVHLVDPSVISTSSALTPFNGNAAGASGVSATSQSLAFPQADLASTTAFATPAALDSNAHAQNQNGLGASHLHPRVDADSNHSNNEDAADAAAADDEGGEDPRGGALAFWFALQEALWEVDIDTFGRGFSSFYAERAEFGNIRAAVAMPLHRFLS